MAKPQSRPPVKFKELEDLVTSGIPCDELPIKVRADYFRLTDITVRTSVSVQCDKNNLTVNLYMRVTSMSHHMVHVQEDVIKASSLTKVFYLMPGQYRLDVAVKDVVSGRRNKYETTLLVPSL